MIKIDEPDTGDETRYWGPPFVAGQSAYFLALNRNKQSVVLDLKIESQLAMLHRIARQSDVVVQNFRPGVAELLGIGYEALRSENRGIVYASISGFDLPGRTKRDRDMT